MKKEIPKFKSEKEEANFWENNSTMDFDDIVPAPEVDIKLTKEAQEKIKSGLKPVTLRLKQSQIDDVKEIAESKGIPYQTLIRMWVSDAIRTEKMTNDSTNILIKGGMEKEKYSKVDIILPPIQTNQNKVSFSSNNASDKICANYYNLFETISLDNISPNYFETISLDNNDTVYHYNIDTLSPNYVYFATISQNPIENYSKLDSPKIETIRTDDWDTEEKDYGCLRVLQSKGTRKRRTSKIPRKINQKPRINNITREVKKIG